MMMLVADAVRGLLMGVLSILFATTIAALSDDYPSSRDSFNTLLTAF